MTRSCGPHDRGDLDERIDRSLVQLHALPGLDARAIGRAIGVPPIRVRVNHWLHRHSTVRASVSRVRVEVAERLFREQPVTLATVVVLARTADAAGFHSTDEMNRAFLRYRHRSGFEVLLAGRVGVARAAA
ncbi:MULTISPECIES: hypothetical protein [unclassified Rathayibacter]|uniref:hypothetical protein n=1 Tax=unclassified Rathayibacter TaxID=2609250 RepID=UPI000701E74E|nr:MULTISPECIES: hypothetical protein [unclassified Rathayibacter]KQQ05975.1 hypothetical protein ASF42_05405 [Rathayibacter sp. Leaf294]KQS13832.1 hypothetical protein ASG06_05415 [Rathayibacter sp. Leaf185]